MPTARLTLLLLGGMLLALPAEAKFRFDEIEPRSFDYNDEYFLNIFNYRRSITARQRFRRAAVGYSITAGSLRNDELYVNHRATLRLPYGDHLSGQYAFVESEDYDARFLRNEVELVFRTWRPERAVPLSETFGTTPAADGLFFGGRGLLDADKEFADLGLLAGYSDGSWGVRLDVLAMDLFFNEKNKEQGEFETPPYTLELDAWLSLLNGHLTLAAWFHNDLPLRLTLPQRQGGLSFRYRQLRAGFNTVLEATRDVRVDLEVWMERTRKRRVAPLDPDPRGHDRLNREALKAYLQLEFDADPLIERSSLREDMVFGGVHVHLLNEVTRRPLTPSDKDTLRRAEAYVELGYVLGMPSFEDRLDWGLRASLSGGLLSWRDVRPSLQKHRVTNRFLAKASLGAKLSVSKKMQALLQLTYRLDSLTFGGANVQVTMHF